jgi:short-subunit dehydrogenase
MQFENRTVLITGASSGIGRALVEQLSKVHCRLLIVSRRLNVLCEIASSLQGQPSIITPFQCDVSDPAQVAESYAKMRDSLGPIEIAILNAGINPRTDLGNLNAETARSVMGVNFFGVVNWLEHLLPEMTRSRSGHIAAVSSLADRKGFPNSTLYCASKAALTLFLESLRIELLEYRIKVTTVRPGFVDTPMNERNDFHLPFLKYPAANAATRILRGIRTERRTVSFPLIWVIGNKLLEFLPLAVTDRMISTFLKPR